MSGDFWLGLAALPVAATAVAVSAWLLVGARKTWHAIHSHLLWQRVELRADLRPVLLAPWNRAKGDQPPAAAPTYEREAERIRAALVRVPRMYLIAGLGWQIAIIRDFKNDPRSADASDSDAAP